ncbi:MAG: ABC transporter substrate-binding protein [Bdellovibrionota bacterium]
MKNWNLAILALAIAVSGVAFAAEPGAVGNPGAPQGGTFLENLGLEPESLNPITSTDIYARQVQAYTLDSLMERDPDTYEWVPQLAEKYETSKDGKQFTFTLRKGATWSDGKPVTIEDVKFSFDVIFDTKYNAAHLRPYYENIEKAEVVGTDQIRFTTKTKYFDNFSVVAELTVLPKHIYGNPTEGMKLNRSLVGSGPYVIETYDKGQSMVLAKNKTWWGNGLPQMKGRWNFEKIRMRFIKDSNIAIEALKKGDIHFHELTAEEFAKKTENLPKTVVKVQTQNLAPKSFGYVGWNFKNEIFKDRDTRLALYHLMNRDEMNKKFRYGMSLPATGPWYQQSEYADPTAKPVSYDPKKAVELLKKVGWTDSDKDGTLDRTVAGAKKNLSFTLFYANKDNEKYYVLYQSDLKKVGIDMKLQLLEWNALLKKLDEKQFDAVALGWGGGSVDNDPKQIWHSASSAAGGSNYISYSNPTVDKMIDEARAELDKKKRIPLLRKVYTEIANDVPYAFMFNDKYVMYAHNTKVGKPKDTFKYRIGNAWWWMTAQ